MQGARNAALAVAKQLNRCGLRLIGDRCLMASVAGALGGEAMAAVALTACSTIDFGVPVAGGGMVAVMVRTYPHWDRAMIRLMIDRVGADDRIAGVVVIVRSNLMLPHEVNGKPVFAVLAGKAWRRG